MTPEEDNQKDSLPLLKQQDFRLLREGREMARFVTLPGYMREMVYGYLLSEGFVADLCAITVLKADAHLMDVHITESGKKTAHEEKTAVEKEDVFRLAEAFRQGMPLHEKTYMTHSALLMHKKDVIFSCEDLGRHNALDKAIGYAFLKGIPLSECFVYMSGRLQRDAVEKAVRSGLAALISKASATEEAVRVARENGLTLIGKARPDEAYILSEEVK